MLEAVSLKFWKKPYKSKGKLRRGWVTKGWLSGQAKATGVGGWYKSLKLESKAVRALDLKEHERMRARKGNDLPLDASILWRDA